MITYWMVYQQKIKVYYSLDAIYKGSSTMNDEDVLYPIEFLNSLSFLGIPNYALLLKIGVPVMILRNINERVGLCNGTRLVIT